MAGIVTFAAVDCDEQANRGLCEEFEVKGFPTIKYIKPFKGRVDAQGLPWRNETLIIVDYMGPRTAKGLTDFVKDNMENRVVRLTDDNLASFLANNVLQGILKLTSERICKGNHVFNQRTRFSTLEIPCD